MNFKNGIKAGFLFVLAAGLAACGPSPTPQAYVQQPAPQTQYQQAPVQQYPQQAPVVVQQETGISTGTAVLGAAAIGAAGYMAGKAMSDKDRQVNNTTVYRDRPAYVQPNMVPQPTVTPPVAKAAPAPAFATPASKAFVPQAAAKTATITQMRSPSPPPAARSSFTPSVVAKRR